MKKLVLLFSAAVMAVSVSAQTVTESKTFDNFYIGVNGGVSSKTTGVSWMHHLNPNAGLRIGRWFTPVFGLAADGTAYFNTKGWTACSTGTAVNYTNISLLGTVNLSNWFGGYPGEPRNFEVVALYGFGWGHGYGHENNVYAKALKNNDQVTSKAAIDFVFNLGAKKAWQFYIEPSMNWAVAGTLALSGDDQTQYNINRSAVQLNAGFIYKFGNSNGTHNFTVHELDQTLIDRLNAEINDLRGKLNAKDSDIEALKRRLADLQRQLDECLKRPVEVKKDATATNLQPTVLFRQGSSTIDPAQYAPIELIASYMKNHPEAKVHVKGYASPEGPADLNQKLSVDRANVVMNALIKKYKIAADRLSAEGCGVTDKLFEQIEFNRVATFNDTTK